MLARLSTFLSLFQIGIRKGSIPLKIETGQETEDRVFSWRLTSGVGDFQQQAIVFCKSLWGNKASIEGDKAVKGGDPQSPPLGKTLEG